ncbi:MAG: hemerythrin domain-containing protein [Burkholderiaceae bacterium]
MRLHQIGQPGERGGAVGFAEAPFEMLTTCHERVDRMLRLLARLREHLASHGHDEQAAQAARDIMRYFDLAAPLHHEDEELHVFPVLLAQGSDALRSAVRRLQQDHVDMGHAWPRARALLQAVSDAGLDGAWRPWDAGALQTLDDFAGRYGEHIRLEEDVVYPAAQAVLDARALATMGEDMQRRRIQPTGT